ARNGRAYAHKDDHNCCDSELCTRTQSLLRSRRGSLHRISRFDRSWLRLRCFGRLRSLNRLRSLGCLLRSDGRSSALATESRRLFEWRTATPAKSAHGIPSSPIAPGALLTHVNRPFVEDLQLLNGFSRLHGGFDGRDSTSSTQVQQDLSSGAGSTVIHSGPSVMFIRVLQRSRFSAVGCGAACGSSYFCGAQHAERSRELSLRISGFCFKCFSVSRRMLAAARSAGIASRYCIHFPSRLASMIPVRRR